MLNERRLSAGHGRALLAAKDAVALAREAVRYGMSVRQVENAAQSSQRAGDGAASVARPQRDPNVAALEKELAIILGMRVAIRGAAAGQGEIAVKYRTLDQLEDLVARLKLPPRG